MRGRARQISLGHEVPGKGNLPAGRLVVRPRAGVLDRQWTIFDLLQRAQIKAGWRKRLGDGGRERAEPNSDPKRYNGLYGWALYIWPWVPSEYRRAKKSPRYGSTRMIVCFETMSSETAPVCDVTVK